MAEDMTFPGFLISFDGVDSSGKETQAGLLVARLREQGRTVHTFASPDYNTPSGQELKARFQNKVGVWEETPWQEKMQFFSKNRAEHRDEVLAALSAGDIVIYDRYVPSSIAFMAVEAQKEDASLTTLAVKDIVEQEEYETRAMPRENISIFLDVPPAMADKLLNQRKKDLGDPDEYTDHISVQERLYEEYETLMSADPEHYVRIACLSGDALLSLDDIAETAWNELLKQLPTLGT